MDKMYSLADAIIEEKIDIVHALLQHGVDPNQIDEYGFTPLIEAAIADNVEIADLLLQSGASSKQQDSLGATALHWAAENNNVKLAKLLLKYQANPNAYNFAGQPVLVMPLLRQQQELKTLLQRHGADLLFAQDYINTKTLGHMFELVGTANIVDPKNNFVEVDFEGFFLEVSLAIITDSLAQFKNHFAARKLRRYVSSMQAIIHALARASHLIRYQQYRINPKKHQAQIDSLIQQEPLVIPVGYEGHAITFIKLGNIFVKCDRREDSRLYDNLTIYQIKRPSVFTQEFIQNLLYEKQTDEFINEHLDTMLGLQPVTELKISAQISGNCSWANVEGCIPALFFLLFGQEKDFEENITRYKNLSLDLFAQWREWNKDRSLQFCIQSFRHADKIRKACKAEILAAILFQSCGGGTSVDNERAESILTAIAIPEYEHVLRNYVRSYCYEDQSEEGQNFLRLLKNHGFKF
jgi:hypothetical protein